MKQNTVYHLLMSLGLLANGALAFSQVTTAPAAFVDPHPYQSQTILRMVSENSAPATFEVIPATGVKDFKYRIQGNSALVSELDTALLYDKRNSLPEMLVAGNNYAFFDGNLMTTTSADGSFIFKGKMNYSPKVVGGVYFTKAENDQLVVIDSYGYYFDTGVATPSIKFAGGNYFIDEAGALSTVKSMGITPGNGVGMVFKVLTECFDKIIGVGGNYFLKSDGTIVTVSSVTGFYSAPYTPSSKPAILGGNYFIGSDRYLYTISNKGVLVKDTDYQFMTNPEVAGYSYMRFSDGAFVVIDGDGLAHKSLMRVSTTGIQAEVTKTLPGNIDSKSVYRMNQTFHQE